jgi:hypothetical protein
VSQLLAPAFPHILTLSKFHLLTYPSLALAAPAIDTDDEIYDVTFSESTVCSLKIPFIPIFLTPF